ncbi:DUF1292 domain-containing protein [Paenibacillus mendelii]|uniref:DUF1292 domain-containing protein n=1 Tax=Paenibacillus mendelii TaxID=206163 RepID=A0ABV6J9L9_9BACL|nr:DUF1292 domain-containing protein [Paenibacillus mendelii]MCQ6563798.1 DUF1292 domain-containing protein [Paenibacillus mendelii]
MMENGDVLTLVDDEGSEQEVEVLGSLDLENQHYIAVAYLDELELEDGEKEKEDLNIFFLQVNESDELSVIENDEEFEKVSSAFEAALEQR